LFLYTTTMLNPRSPSSNHGARWLMVTLQMLMEIFSPVIQIFVPVCSRRWAQDQRTKMTEQIDSSRSDLYYRIERVIIHRTHIPILLYHLSAPNCSLSKTLTGSSILIQEWLLQITFECGLIRSCGQVRDTKRILENR